MKTYFLQQANEDTQKNLTTKIEKKFCEYVPRAKAKITSDVFPFFILVISYDVHTLYREDLG